MLQHDASPKAISRRTSYLRVRLEFLRYPQVIRAIFNLHRFGPPVSFTSPSTCSWLGHPVSGLILPTWWAINPRFHCGSIIWLSLADNINSLDRSTKSTPSQHEAAPTPCRHWVSGSISLPSRGSFHLSITVLVRYRSFAIFSLGRWSCQIQTGFLVPRPTCENTYKF